MTMRSHAFFRLWLLRARSRREGLRLAGAVQGTDKEVHEHPLGKGGKMPHLHLSGEVHPM